MELDDFEKAEKLGRTMAKVELIENWKQVADEVFGKRNGLRKGLAVNACGDSYALSTLIKDEISFTSSMRKDKDGDIELITKSGKSFYIYPECVKESK